MNRYHKIIVFPVIIIFLSLILSGCWSNKDISERALIAAVGLDMGEDKQIEFTIQIINPAVVSAQQPGTPNESPVWIHTSKGTTVFEAIRNQFKVSNKSPFYSHIQLIVIGEKMAKEGISDVLDFFERNHETRLTANILIAKGTTAQKILSLKSSLEQIPAVHLQGIIAQHEKSGEIQNSRLIDVVKALSNEGIQPTISVIEIANAGGNSDDMHNIMIQGSGVFREDRLIGWLEPEETVGLLYIKNMVKGGIINVSNPMEKGKTISIEEIRSSVKTDVKFIDNKPYFYINIDAHGSIAGQQGRKTTADPFMLKELEKECERKLKSIAANTMTVSQKKYKCDIVGVGEIMHIKYTEYWKQVKNDWRNIYSRIPVEINVDFTIQRTGRMNTPI